MSEADKRCKNFGATLAIERFDEDYTFIIREPNDLKNEDCIELRLKDGIFWLNDIPCNILNGYVYCSPGPADIVFVVDTSSIFENKTTMCSEYLGRVLDGLPLGNEAFQVAVISYVFEPKELITLGKYQNAKKIKEVSTGNHFEAQGSTYTGNALRKCFEILDEQAKQKAHKIIIIISDGLSTDRYEAINEAKNFTVWPYHVIIAVGIGEQIDHSELFQLASKDQKDIYGPLVFSSSNDDALNMILRKAMHEDCTRMWFSIPAILCHWETRPDNGFAYLFEDGKVTWSEADERCKNFGGTLAIPRFNEDQNFIVNTLHTLNKSGYFYIGGRKSDGGMWTWIDGTFINKSDPRWGADNACLSSPCINNGKCTPMGRVYDCECELTLSNKHSCNIDCSPGPADIVFVVDTSSSLENKTNKSLEHMGRILDRLPLGKEGFQVAIISYDFEPKELLTLGQYQNAEEIKKVATGIHFETQGSTYTENALRKSFEILTDENARQKAHKFIVLISDGLSTDRYEAIKEAERFLSWPYHVITTIGIGEQIDHFELVQLASKDQNDIYGPLVFSSSNDDAINMILRQAMHKNCTDCRVSSNTDVIIIQDNNFSGVVFQYSLSVASEIAHKYFLTKKDIRVGRISFDVNDFAYYSHDDQFLVNLQKLSPGENSESNIESLLSDAAVQLSSSGLSSGLKRNKVIVIITDGRWSNVSRVEEKMNDLRQQNITVMIVAVTKDSNFTTLYRVVQDPFYVFYINDKNRWDIIDIIISQSFRVICE
ncbi:uncharacterized protein LOC133182294 [Saccostrea echinata]|uniref:uncharacterized protein LOC133182294 n=1 Tax=Saccostrea echinata TaxID=191078 RepID=UPI002A8025E5|nr:uncharacterized protein LOC133182294 [Saccostrea echinata]